MSDIIGQVYSYFVVKHEVSDCDCDYCTIKREYVDEILLLQKLKRNLSFAELNDDSAEMLKFLQRIRNQQKLIEEMKVRKDLCKYSYVKANYERTLANFGMKQLRLRPREDCQNIGGLTRIDWEIAQMENYQKYLNAVTKYQEYLWFKHTDKNFDSEGQKEECEKEIAIALENLEKENGGLHADEILREIKNNSLQESLPGIRRTGSLTRTQASTDQQRNKKIKMEPQKVKVSLMDAEWVKCGKGAYTTQQATMFKKLSAIRSPTGQEQLIPIQMELCVVCGKVPPYLLSMLPPDMPEHMLPSDECKSSFLSRVSGPSDTLLLPKLTDKEHAAIEKHAREKSAQIEGALGGFDLEEALKNVKQTKDEI